MAASNSSPSFSSSSNANALRKDEIVKIEIEAAEVLAGLAHSSSSQLMIDDTDDSDLKRCIKSEQRGRKRVCSDLTDFEVKPKFSDAVAHARSSDLSQGQGQALLEKQQCGELCRNVNVSTIKAEEAESHKTSPMCSKSRGSFCSSRSRQNISEADQEERRIRRILANRESARQTIRRRQAVCDELTKKVTDLSLVNANLKKEKELAKEEYASLKNLNDFLKEQMAMSLNSEQVERSIEQTSPHAETSGSPSTSSSLFLCNPSQFSPFVRPFIIQSSNPMRVPDEHQNVKMLISCSDQSSDPVKPQHDPQNSTVFPPGAAVKVIGNADSTHEQANPSNFDGSKAPICLLPCQWYFPLADHGVGLYHHPSLMKHNQDETTMSSTNNARSSSYPIQVEKESRPAYNLNEAPVDVRSQDEEAQFKEDVFKPALPSPVISAVNNTLENGKLHGYLQSRATPSTCYHSGNPLPIKNRASVIYPNKTPVEVVAAAEARKRRKELTKLKNHRPFRINC